MGGEKYLEVIFFSGGIWAPSHLLFDMSSEKSSFPPTLSPMKSVSNELQLQIFEEIHLLIAIDKLNLG